MGMESSNMFALKKTTAAIAAGVMPILLTVAYLLGRHYAPSRVEYKDRTVEVQKIVTQDRIVTVVDTDKILNALKTYSQAKDVHIIRTVERLPDGTTKTVEEKTDKTQTNTTDEAKQEEKKQETQSEVKAVEKVVYKEHETVKLVERLRPPWAVSVMPGFDFAGALGHGDPANLLPTSLLPSVPGLKHVVLGFSIERRLFGPVSTGVWANTAGMGGLVLRLEF